MGYGIMPYRVSLSRLATRFGNPNSSKRSKARRACASIASNMDDLFGGDGPGYMDIVEELLDGKATHRGYGAWYWYAIERMIGDLGQFLHNGEWYPSRADAFWDHPAARLYDIDAPMDIPSPDDFPTVFVIRNAELNDALLAGFREKISDDAQYRSFSHWVNEAKRYKQDLVLYYY
jgi:hypothetical protein